MRPRRGITLDQFEDVDEVGADVVQLSIGVVAGSDAVERSLDEFEALLKGVVKRAGHAFSRRSRRVSAMASAMPLAPPFLSSSTLPSPRPDTMLAGRFF